MSHGLTKAQRLRRLEELLVLAASTDGLTTVELASRLEVTRQTVWRDINELSVELPIREEDERYWIDPMDYLSNVRLSVGESLMLYLAVRQMIRKMSYAPPSMVSAMERLTVALRHPVASQLATSTQIFRTERAADPERVHVWEKLIRAWTEQITVHMVYQSLARPEARAYEFQPYFFEPALLSEGVYVIGYSLTHDALRTFKVERILRVTLTTVTFTRKDIDVDTLLRHAWGIWYGSELHEVRLRFSPQVANRVKETLWHPSQKLRDLPDGGVEWSVGIAGTLELVPWIRGWGPDVEVIEPQELRQRIAEELRRAAALYNAAG